MEPDISSLIGAIERGDRAAVDALYGALYSELHRLAPLSHPHHQSIFLDEKSGLPDLCLLMPIGKSFPIQG